MRKLIQFNPVAGFGSTGRIAEQIGDFAIENGWDSYIVYSGRPKAKSSSKLIEVGSKWDVISHAIETRLFDRHGLGSKNSTLKLTDLLEQLKPDVLHFHNIHGYYVNYEVLGAYINKSKIPVVWTFHDFWPMTGHCSYFSDVNCEKWKEECFDCPKTAFYPKSYLDNSKFNFNKKKKTFTSIENLTIVPVSKWAGTLVEQSFFKSTDIEVIYNGIDLEIFYPKKSASILKEKLGLSGQFVIIALATTWGKRKGWFDYIKLVELLPSDITLLLVGVNKEQEKELPSAIKFMQKTNDINQLAELYTLADIVMNLSYQETFGLTTVEGFACGTPSIVYNKTASPELMNEHVGEIVEPGDLNDVLNAILKIKDKGKDSFQDKCLNHVREKFNAKDRYKDYLELYERKTATK